MRHAYRSTYSVPVPRILAELAPTNGKCPHFAAPLVSNPAISNLETDPPPPPPETKFRFGRMFDEQAPMIDVLTQLGTSMDKGQINDSINPSGYTYLGQFIAHEITFDKTRGLPAAGAVLNSYRSPQIDLDSLYASDGDPIQRRLFRDDGQSALLNIGMTVAEPNLILPKPNDLFRDETGKAIIADERNDENLGVAQVQVAFMSFHNTIVERLREEGTPDDQLRATARAEVVKHFQWIVLHDFLARLLDQDVLREVVDAVLNDGRRFYKPDPAAPFMPLEFSAATFRMGHSMVRSSYEWNYVHSPELNSDAIAPLDSLFRETNFSGSIKQGIRTPPRLPSRWIIDWRRFFDFSVITANNLPIYRAPNRINLARRIDTTIDLSLKDIKDFDHTPFEGAQRSLAVRNLLRGYALGLPTGEDVAELMGEKDRLSQDEIASGFEDVFNSHWLKGKTPLWFYILREAEIRNSGNRLGRVGSRIVAETLVTLIKNSDYSIFNNDGWQPRSSRFGPEGERIFQMVDLLHFADVVNPINL